MNGKLNIKIILGSGPYQCDRCFKRFTRKGGLWQHKTYICGQEAQFKCLYCSHRSKLRPDMRKHLRRVHNYEDY